MSNVILLMDNTQSFLDVQSRLLEQAGYHVLRASTVKEAEQQLDSRNIQLAILDIRMEDENDERDISGLVLARAPAYRSLPKIILTAYPSRKHMREVLLLDEDNIQLAVDFVSKDDDPDILMQAVKRAFERDVRINPKLSIHTEDRHCLRTLIPCIAPDIADEYFSERLSELEDLFRSLFYNSSQIILGRLFVQRPGFVLVEVFTYGQQHRTGQFIVACGQKQQIKDENQRYHIFVPKVTNVGGTIQEQKLTAEMLHLAATGYTLIGGNCEEIVPFGVFCQTHSIEEVLATVNYLYNVVLGAWWRRGRVLQESTMLVEHYLKWLGLNNDEAARENIGRRARAICEETIYSGMKDYLLYAPRDRTLKLSTVPTNSYPDPGLEFHTVQMTENIPVFFGTIHGVLQAESILVSQQGETWLIDFAQADHGPLLCDFIALEMAIKLDVFETSSLSNCYLLEGLLLEARRLDDLPVGADLPDEIKPALKIIQHIRTLAATLTGSDMYAYLYGIFLYSLRRVAAYDPDHHYTCRALMPFAHSLLSAAMLYKKLTGGTDRPPPIPEYERHKLWIDQVNKDVWVAGRWVGSRLTVQDFKILTYLYQRSGELCLRQEILELAIGVKPTEVVVDESLLNSAMSRLRKKIEPDPDNPKYILSVRGQGYKLDAQKVYISPEASSDTV